MRPGQPGEVLQRRIQFVSKPTLQFLSTLPPKTINEQLEIKPGCILHSLRFPMEYFFARQFLTTVTDDDGTNYTSNDIFRPFIQDVCSTQNPLSTYEWWLKNESTSEDKNIKFVLEDQLGVAGSLVMAAVMLREQEEDRIPDDIVIRPWFQNVSIPAQSAGATFTYKVPGGKRFFLNNISFTNDGVGTNLLALWEAFWDFKARRDNDQNGLTRQPIMGYNFLSVPCGNIIPLSYPGWPGYYPIPQGETATLTITLGTTAMSAPASIILRGWVEV